MINYLEYTSLPDTKRECIQYIYILYNIATYCVSANVNIPYDKKASVSQEH